MEKSFTLIQTLATAGAFSAISLWYGFMFGRESARKELGDLIESLRRGNPDSAASSSPSHSETVHSIEKAEGKKYFILKDWGLSLSPKFHGYRYSDIPCKVSLGYL